MGELRDKNAKMIFDGSLGSSGSTWAWAFSRLGRPARGQHRGLHPRPQLRDLRRGRRPARAARLPRERGMVAVSGLLPRSYCKDEEKTARAFKVMEGIRWAMPGDWAG